MLKKIIYSTAGLILTGPIGAVAGYFIGNEADSKAFKLKWDEIYFNLGILAKIDGNVNTLEVAFIKYLTEDILKLDFNRSLPFLESFKRGKSSDPSSTNLKLNSDEFAIFFELAKCDSTLNYFEFKFLDNLAKSNNLIIKDESLQKLVEAYHQLELPPFSDFSFVKKSYHRLALELHPDSNKEISAEEKFINVQNAYKLIEKFCNPTNINS